MLTFTNPQPKENTIELSLSYHDIELLLLALKLAAPMSDKTTWRCGKEMKELATHIAMKAGKK